VARSETTGGDIAVTSRGRSSGGRRTAGVCPHARADARIRYGMRSADDAGYRHV